MILISRAVNFYLVGLVVTTECNFFSSSIVPFEL